MEPSHGESLAERFEVLAAPREEGLIRHLGISNVDATSLPLSPVTLASPGTGSVAHLEKNLAARSITLTEEDLA